MTHLPYKRSTYVRRLRIARVNLRALVLEYEHLRADTLLICQRWRASGRTVATLAREDALGRCIMLRLEMRVARDRVRTLEQQTKQ